MTSSLTVVAIKSIFKYIDIFAAKFAVFAIFQDRNFNITSANNFAKFRTTGP